MKGTRSWERHSNLKNGIRAVKDSYQSLANTIDTHCVDSENFVFFPYLFLYCIFSFTYSLLLLLIACSPVLSSFCTMTGESSNPTGGNWKPYAITNIKSFVPLILDLNQLNYDSWRVLFQTHCTNFAVLEHLEGISKPQNDKDTEWFNVDSLVKMWIYETLTQSLLNMVTKPGSTANCLWLDTEALFHDNKEACIL